MGNKNTKTTVKTTKKEDVFKILLLGSGESGKTTIHKQVKILFDNGFTNKKELEGFKNAIYSNILTTVNSCTELAKKKGCRFS